MSGSLLRDENVVELRELLEFVADWVDHDFAILRVSQARFCGSGYTTEELRADLARFILVLGGPADRFVGGDAE